MKKLFKFLGWLEQQRINAMSQSGRVMEWHTADNGGIVEQERPTKIYIAQ